MSTEVLKQVQYSIDPDKTGIQVIHPPEAYGGIHPGNSIFDEEGKLCGRILPEPRLDLPTDTTSVFNDMTEVDFYTYDFFESVPLVSSDDRSRQWLAHATRIVENPLWYKDCVDSLSTLVDNVTGQIAQRSSERGRELRAYQIANEMITPHALRKATTTFVEQHDVLLKDLHDTERVSTVAFQDNADRPVRECDIRLQKVIDAEYALQQTHEAYSEKIRQFARIACLSEEENHYLTQLIEGKETKQREEMQQAAKTRALGQVIIFEPEVYCGYIRGVLEKSEINGAATLLEAINSRGVRLAFEQNEAAMSVLERVLEIEKSSDDAQRRNAATRLRDAIDEKKEYGFLLSDRRYEDRFRLTFLDAIANTSFNEEKRLLHRLQQAQTGRIILSTIAEKASTVEHEAFASYHYGVMASLVLNEQDREVAAYLLANISLNGDIYYYGNKCAESVFTCLGSDDIGRIGMLYDVFNVVRYANRAMGVPAQSWRFKIELEKALKQYNAHYWTTLDINPILTQLEQDLQTVTATPRDIEGILEQMYALQQFKDSRELSCGLRDMYQCDEVRARSTPQGMSIKPRNSRLSNKDLRDSKTQINRIRDTFQRLQELFLYKIGVLPESSKAQYDDYVTKMGRDFTNVRYADRLLNNQYREAVIAQSNSDDPEETISLVALPLGIRYPVSWTTIDERNDRCKAAILSSVGKFSEGKPSQHVWRDAEVTSMLEYLRPFEFDRNHYTQTYSANLSSLRGVRRGLSLFGATTVVIKDPKFSTSQIGTVTLSPHRIALDEFEGQYQKCKLDYLQRAVRMRIGDKEVIIRLNHNYVPISANGKSLRLSEDALLYWSTIFSSLERDCVCRKQELNTEIPIRTVELVEVSDEGQRTKVVKVKTVEHFRRLDYGFKPSSEQIEAGLNNPVEVFDVNSQNETLSTWRLKSGTGIMQEALDIKKCGGDTQIIEALWNYLRGHESCELPVIDLCEQLQNEGYLDGIVEDTTLRSPGFPEAFTERLYPALCRLEIAGIVEARRYTFVKLQYEDFADLEEVLEKTNGTIKYHVGDITKGL